MSIKQVNNITDALNLLRDKGYEVTFYEESNISPDLYSVWSHINKRYELNMEHANTIIQFVNSNLERNLL